MPYTIERIAQMMGAQRMGSVEAEIDCLLTDSRSLSFPETTLFFALTTKRDSGARYVPQLAARGVRAFVLTEADLDRIRFGEWTITACPLEEINFLVVATPLRALQQLAEEHRKRFHIPVVGITGSNGKTVVKEWLHQLLSPDRRVVRSPRSYNSQVGVPLSVWQMDESSELAIFEAGISEPGEMKSLQAIIQPTIGILTHIGGAHQENFFSLQEKCMEKLRLMKSCEVIIYNGDDEFISRCVSRAMVTSREVAWSRRDPDKPLYISKVERDGGHTLISYRYLGMANTFSLPFIDDASIENCLHCLAACLYLTLPPSAIARRMAQLEPVAMRLEVKEGKHGCLLINDSYNSDLASLDIALDFLCRRAEAATTATAPAPRSDSGPEATATYVPPEQNRQAFEPSLKEDSPLLPVAHRPLKKTLVLSDLLETGQPSAQLYRHVAQLVAGRGIDRIIGVGREISSCADRFGMERAFYPDTPSLIRDLESGRLRFHDELLLIKGARAFGFDALTELLVRKVHETTLEVNLSALVANLNHYRSFLRPGTRMVCMVKASAYGAGAVEVARTLQEHRVDYLAVAVADEGADLRRAGITANLLVMNPEVSAFKTLFDYRLEPEVYSFPLLEALIREAEREGITRLPIHIKLDTGMHRLGFAPADVPRLVQRLRRQDAVIPRSVFSHLAGADEARHDDFTRRQIALFQQAAATLQAAYNHLILRHICNSAAIERFPEAQMEMVRLGLGLYGIRPQDNATLHTVCALRTIILQIREVPQEETVGYGRHGQLTRASRIAAIPIGYADGLNRRLGRGRCYCLVNGQPAPYVGNICMDVCMVDVTDIPCHEGDPVEIFGPNLPVSVLSDALDTIPYEVLTAVSTRVRRVYYQD